MDKLNANEAKTHFGELLLKVQRSPVQINKNGKPVAVVISTQEYENIESLKLELLKARAVTTQQDINSNNLLDGDSFFDELEAGDYD